MPFLSPATAPIMGGYLTQNVSWRWVFWITSIFDLAVQLACFLLLRETHHPTVLKNKAKALKRATGNPNLHTKWQGPDHSMKKILMKALVRPFIMLTTQPALQAMALFRGYQYGLMYLVFATFPSKPFRPRHGDTNSDTRFQGFSRKHMAGMLDQQA